MRTPEEQQVLEAQLRDLTAAVSELVDRVRDFDEDPLPLDLAANYVTSPAARLAVDVALAARRPVDPGPVQPGPPATAVADVLQHLARLAAHFDHLADTDGHPDMVNAHRGRAVGTYDAARRLALRAGVQLPAALQTT